MEEWNVASSSKSNMEAASSEDNESVHQRVDLLKSAFISLGSNFKGFLEEAFLVSIWYNFLRRIARLLLFFLIKMLDHLSQHFYCWFKFQKVSWKKPFFVQHVL